MSRLFFGKAVNARSHYFFPNIYILYIIIIQSQHSGSWTAHTAKVLDLAWSPDSKHIASGSLDTNIIVWDVEEPSKKIRIESKYLDVTVVYPVNSIL